MNIRVVMKDDSGEGVVINELFKFENIDGDKLPQVGDRVLKHGDQPKVYEVLDRIFDYANDTLIVIVKYSNWTSHMFAKYKPN